MIDVLINIALFIGIVVCLIGGIYFSRIAAGKESRDAYDILNNKYRGD